ncbi:hypothetical protein [Limnoglobus roseus]|uniref:Uncharacterized protein n=1 Tax=Limnoglobus roseus TaxID=2598579 RepID=A0A5C1A674_9BACT|nr:hypothetical protein [Limnoglobus roseus]QEL13833.1 hypothetical protein PX52LOC_00691 [Limnoglobus roseus]
MFARRTLMAGAIALLGLSADTASAQMIPPPAALPTTVVTQSTPAVETTTAHRGLFGRRAARTTVTPASYTTPVMTAPVLSQAATVTQTQLTIPVPMPMPSTTVPSVTTTPGVTTTPTIVTTTPPVVTTESAPMMSTTAAPVTVTEGTTTPAAGRVRTTRTGLFSRIFRR